MHSNADDTLWRLALAGNADTLRALARAVCDLADGMGADEQEWYRAREIAVALYQIANGRFVDPLRPHEVARGLWFTPVEDLAAWLKERDAAEVLS
jgi:sirohydrochlorin ferrochelatase